MMTQKLFATSLVAICLATTSLASGNAVADANSAFFPKYKWSIKQNISDTGAALKSCSIGSQLNNGYAIKLSGTSEGFTKLNLDFKQNIFKENIEYKVKYSIPGIEDRTVSAKAEGGNVLISDFSQDNDFAGSLRTAGAIDIKINNTEFRVYLTGFESMMDEYAACVGDGGVAIAAQEMPQQPMGVNGAYAPPPPLNIEADSTEPQKLFKGAANKAVDPEESLRPAASDKPRYTEELAEELKKNSQKYEPSSLNQDGVEVGVQLAIGEVSSKTMESIKSPEIVYNRTKLKPISVDLTNAAQQGYMSGAAKMATITPASGSQGVDGDIVGDQSKISMLKDKIGVLINKNKMLDEELRVALSDAEHERLSVSSDNWDLERATMKFNEAERQVMRLGRQLQTQKAQCQKEKTGLENILFDPELTNQEQLASLAALESKLDQQKSDFYRKTRKYEERIMDLEKKINSK